MHNQDTELNNLIAFCDSFDYCVLIFDAQTYKVIYASWCAQALFHIQEGQNIDTCFDPSASIMCRDIMDELVCNENIFRKINILINEEVTSLDFAFASLSEKYIVVDVKNKSHASHEDSITVLEEKLSAITRLSDGIAHNLRSPLMALRGISDYMIFLVAQWDNIVSQTCSDCILKKDREKTNFLLHQMRDDIRSNVTVVTDIINDLKAYNKLDRFNDFVKTDIADLINKVIKMLEYNTKLSAEIIFTPPEVKIPLLYCIPSDIQVVLTNLIENAIEQIIFTKTKNGHIQVNLAQHGNSVVIKVRDNGGGISSEVLKKNKLFEPFVTTKKNEGTGFGLHSSFKIIKEHGGNIYAKNIKSNIGTGAEFTVILPLK